MKESHFNRFISPSEEEVSKVRGDLKYLFKTQERATFQSERSKSSEELEIIDFLDDETNKVAESFGGEALSVSQNNIHLLQDEIEFIDFAANKEAEAVVKQDLQCILIKDKKQGLLHFTAVLFHEMDTRFGKKEK